MSDLADAREERNKECGMNDSRKRFIAWAEGEELSCDTTAGGHFAWHNVEKLWQGWSARDSEVERLREALKKCIAKIDSEICTHEDTYRGGVLWTICRGCGMRWADDRGGFKPYKDPEWLAEVRALSSQDKESGK